MKEIINTSIQQGCIKLIKSDSKDIYIVTWMLLFLTYSSKNPGKNVQNHLTLIIRIYFLKQ